MNEVTRIHLGRQTFTISVEAHQHLKTYLAHIEKKTDKDVANEVELRMAELLTEHGVTGEKVVLENDVKFLKEQLGKPEDFGDDAEETSQPAKESSQTSKRLFRDTEHGMIGGVAAGIANYFGIDDVIVRLLFVLLAVFGGGAGLVAYILLWIIVPPAVTASEKLQMQGRQVTLEALKQSVDRADVAGAARRINSGTVSFINGLFNVLIKITGIALVLTGIVIVVGVGVTKMYMMLHDGRLFQEGLFPVGLREEWLLATGMILSVIIAIFLMLAGVAAFKRKWPVRGWVTALLAGLFVAGSIAGIALSADVGPRIQKRYETSVHTTAINNIQKFNKVQTYGNVDISYTSAPDYKVDLRYFDHPDLSKVKVYTKDGTLYIDSRSLDATEHCNMLCLFPRYDMTVRIYAPNVEALNTPGNTEVFYPDTP